MNIREYLNWGGGYSAINREERNLTAILYHVLLLGDNLSRFLALIHCPYVVDESEMGIFLEYAYLRDLWSQIEDNDTKRGLVLALLKPSKVDELRTVSILEFNRYFGAVPQPSTKYVQSPGRWSVPRFDRTIEDDDEFLRVCLFKWAFNAKPDIVIHTSKEQAVCIEAKLESSESQYPQATVDKRIFRSRGLSYVKQTILQRYLMEDLLGIETQFVLLVTKVGHTSDTHQVLLWEDVFSNLDVSGLPRFMHEIMPGIDPLASGYAQTATAHSSTDGGVAMDSVTLLGRPITRDDVLASLRRFDAEYRDTNDYDRWLDKGNYRYALRYRERLYPCKYVLAGASGLDVSDFGGGKQTNSKFTALGFDVIEKPEKDLS